MCKIEGCDRPVLAKGYCSAHYYRQKRGVSMTKPLTMQQGELAALGFHRHHPFYLAWCNMKTRCDNPKSTQYQWYGARGIHYCDEWKEFRNFHRDMWPTWEEGLTLEREKNDEGYSKTNCKWATHTEQANNRRLRIDSVLYNKAGA